MLQDLLRRLLETTGKTKSRLGPITEAVCLLLAANPNPHYLLWLRVCGQETQQGHGVRGCLELFLGRAEECGTGTSHL
ncbi:unnamed protein product [Coccothraustes coccothraustes]